MARIFRKPFRIKLAKPERADEEFGPGKPGVLVCRVCHAVYQRKSWRHGLASSAGRGSKRPHGRKAVRFTLCPACTMIRHRQFEGEVLVENVPRDVAFEVMELIGSFGTRAYARDPEHRLIGTEMRRPDRIRVTTTENQMAKQLAHKIRNSFKRSNLRISFEKEPSDVIRARVTFPEMSPSPAAGRKNR